MDTDLVTLDIGKTVFELEQEYRKLKGLTEFLESYPTDFLPEHENIDHPDCWKMRDFICSSLPENHVSGVEVLKREKKNGAVLYIACGYGGGVKLIECLGYSVKGIDTNEEYVRECVKRGLNVAVDDAFNLTFPDKSIDIVISRDFLVADYFESHDYNMSYSESINAIIEGLMEQHRILKEGGVAISYSLLGDDLDCSARFAANSRLPVEALGDLPFRALRRYTLNFKERIKYVDVFEK